MKRSDRRPVLACFLGVGLLAALTGCVPSHVAVRPQSSDLIVSRNEATRAAFVRVPETGAGGLDVRVTSSGAFRHKRAGDASVSLSVEVEVENRSESIIAGFDPATALLTASYRRDLSPVASVASAARGEVTTVAIEPGARRTFHLDFAAKGTADPRELAPFSLKLTFDYGRSEVHVVVPFVRDEDAYYGYPSYAPSYGVGIGPAWGWGWGPSYYGRWDW